jgi:hypothetical protein
MPSDPIAVPISPALKEWAVLCKALGEGRQVVLIRKGGIREETKDFRVRYDEFFLYPTYDHQRADLIKTEYHPDLDAVLAEEPDPALHVRIAYFARVTDAFETSDEAMVSALDPHYIFADNYASERLHWRPKKPLEVMLLRVYRLAAPHTLAVLPEYGGCKSWLDLGVPISRQGMVPALDDAAYDVMARPVRALFTAAVAS